MLNFLGRRKLMGREFTKIKIVTKKETEISTYVIQTDEKLTESTHKK